jgi:hypothetical protein
MDGAICSHGWLRYAMAGVFAALGLALHVGIGDRLGQTGVLHEWDVLFSADPTVYVTSFTTGQNTYRWGGRSFVHPNISNVLFPIVHASGAALHALRPSLPAGVAARRVAYLICPLASAATAAVLFFLFTELELGLVGGGALVLLYLASFSAVVFGSIPESYCLSGLALAVLFYVVARAARGDRAGAVPDGVWVAVGTALASITITNIASFGLAAIAVRRQSVRLPPAALWAVRVAGMALLITLAGYALGAALSSRAPAFTPTASGQIEERHAFEPAIAFIEFPMAVANTLAPPVPLKVPADPLLHQDMRFALTYHTLRHIRPGAWWRTALILAVLLLSVVSARFLPSWQRTVIGAAALVLGFNWIFHAFYGSEMFLYSQHWAIPLLVILAGLAAVRGSYRRPARLLLGLLVMFCAWNSLAVWRATLAMLR